MVIGIAAKEIGYKKSAFHLQKLINTIWKKSIL